MEDLKTIYILFIRSILEQSSPVWHSSITEENKDDLERIQKSAVKIILQEKYKGYSQGLAQLGLEPLVGEGVGQSETLYSIFQLEKGPSDLSRDLQVLGNNIQTK